MDNLEWMLNEIRSQARGIRKQISGLPQNVQESIINECVDILKSTNTEFTNTEIIITEKPSLDRDGCVYWDHVIIRKW